MKVSSRWIAVFAVAMLAGATARANWQSVDTWDMEGNEERQLSDNGTDLGDIFATNSQQVAQVPDDGTFIFSPSNLPKAYPAKSDLSSPIDLRDGVVRISFTMTAADWTADGSLNTKMGFRLYDDAASSYMGVEIGDIGTTDKIFAYAKVSTDLTGGSKDNIKAGRLSNTLEISTSHTVILEIDYANNEVRMGGDWEWYDDEILPGGVLTIPVDFAAAGITSISKFQPYYGNWSEGDQITIDQIAVLKRSSEGIHIVQQVGLVSKNSAETNTFASLSVTNGDCVVVGAAANNGKWAAVSNLLTFSGSASLGSVTHTNLAGSGPRSYLWYVPVSSTGTVDVTVSIPSDNTAYAAVSAYVIRSTSGGVKVLDIAGVGSTTNVVTDLAYTNIFEFGTASTGVFIEAAATYATTIDSENPDFEEDVVSGTYPRKVGSAEFADAASITNIWTIDEAAKRQTVVLGVAFEMGGPVTPTSLYEDFLAEGTDVGSATGMEEDPDGDGLDNLTEYAFGGDAGDPAVQGNVPVESRVSDGGSDYIQLIYFERTDAADRGLASIVEAATSLTEPGWSSGGVEFVGSGPSGIDGYDAVTNRIPVDAENTKFLRLQVEFTP